MSKAASQPSDCSPPAAAAVVVGFSFFAFGDFGFNVNNDLSSAVDSLHRRSLAKQQRPEFIALLGDNVYPRGLKSIDDIQQIRNTFGVFYAKKHRPMLHCPLKIVTGNHDLMESTTAHVELSAVEDDERNPPIASFSEAELNHLYAQSRRFPTKIPRMYQSFGDDGVPSRNYVFSVPLNGALTASTYSRAGSPQKLLKPQDRVDFFVICSNAAQYSARADDPGILERWPQVRSWLLSSLQHSDSLYKVVMCHQPLYTAGRNHGTVAACLRGKTYVDKHGASFAGLDLEALLVQCGVDFVFSGHEHVSQHRFVSGVHHCVAGAVVELGLYGGSGSSAEHRMDWIDKEHMAVMDVSVGVDSGKDKTTSSSSSAFFRVEWRATDYYSSLLHTVEKRKPLSGTSKEGAVAAAAASVAEKKEKQEENVAEFA